MDGSGSARRCQDAQARRCGQRPCARAQARAVSADGINGCAVRQLRFAADQGGGQRLTGAVDRVVIFARALTKDEVANWQARTFG